MRRRLATFALLCLFSLQACWAAAAPYCQYEATKTAPAHAGHHTHEPATDDAAGDAVPGTTGNFTVDADCHACHASVACMTPDTGARAMAAPAAAPDARAAAPLPAPPGTRIDRPDWPRAA